MKLSKGAIIGLILCIVALIAIPAYMFRGADLGGSDDAGGEAVETIAPHYEIWAESPFDPGDMEDAFFHVQQGLGLVVLAGGFYFLYKRSKNNKDVSTEKNNSETGK